MHLGKEIYIFFNQYGVQGLVGLLLSVVLMTIIVYKTLKIIINNKITSYQEFITYIMPKRFKQNKIIGFTINNIINIFLLISFNIMVAGFASYFMQEFNILKLYGAITISIFSFIIFSKNIDGLVKINTYFIPLLILLVIFLGIKNITNLSIIRTENNSNILYWLISSILYASYNSITLIPISISLSKYIDTKKAIKIISIFTFIIILLLSSIIFLLINLFIKEINNIEIPIIYIANTIGENFKYIYGITILIAILTTAISAGYSFLNNVTKSKKAYLIISIIICVCSIFISQIGFSNLINLLYPIFGYLGIIQIIFLLKA